MQGADIHSKIDTGANLIWHAASFGHDEVVDWLLGQNVDPNCSAWFPEEGMPKHVQTSLHVAARHGGVSMLRALLSARADSCARDSFGLTPLDTAIVCARPEALATLL